MNQPLTPSLASSTHPLHHHRKRNHHHNIVSTSDPLGLFAMFSLDLLLEILYKHPVKSLLMLKCVCKSLNSIISDPKFAKDHLRLSHTRRYHLLICPCGSFKDRDFNLFDSQLPSVFDNSKTRTTIIPEKILKFPLNPSIIPTVVIVDSCNGIICFKTTVHNNNHDDLVVWNPCTNKFKILPPLESLPYNITHTLYSFGYDRFIDNYKVVVVSCYNQFHRSYKFCKTQVRIHTLGTDFWRMIAHFPSEIMGVPEGFVGKFVSGTVNWVIKDQHNATSWAILSLDLGNESYQEIPQPYFGLDHPLHSFKLGVSRDCLCIHVRTKDFMDIWVMKDYGNKDSWNKIFTIPFAKLGNYRFSLVGRHYISEEDDQVLLHFGYKIYVYNYKNGTVKILNILGLLSSLFITNVYVESLISPKLTCFAMLALLV